VRSGGTLLSVLFRTRFDVSFCSVVVGTVTSTRKAPKISESVFFARAVLVVVGRANGPRRSEELFDGHASQETFRRYVTPQFRF
jgi:hypothetical protein